MPEMPPRESAEAPDDGHRHRAGEERRRLVPDDPSNRELVDNVHPPDWANPEPAGRYHLVAVGAGTAGLVAAAGAAGLGARVALIERDLMGGDCLNVGCVPSKGIIAASRAWHGARHAARRFGGPPAEGSGDFGAAMERMRRLRAGISHHDSVRRFAELGVDVFLGHGRFTGPDSIEVGDRTLRFRRAVVATGGRAAAPPIPGLDGVPFRTNESIFSLERCPARLGIVGAGPVGSEMAQTFARFGSEVSLFEMADHVLPREEPEAAAVVQAAMARDGVRLETGVRVVEVGRREAGILVTFERGGERRERIVDELLVAVGRRANVEGLGLEAAGVDHDAGGIVVDDRLRTTNRQVFACGDVASRYQFTHTADAQARIVIQNALFFGRARSSDLVVPWCTYTSPEIAHVGMYEGEAREAGHRVETITVPMSEVDRAVLDGEEEGFLRVLHPRGKDRILGATMVAAHAGDIIGELSLAITAGVGLKEISSTIHPYPTQAEAVRKAGDAYRRKSLTPTVEKLFALWFRLLS